LTKKVNTKKEFLSSRKFNASTNWLLPARAKFSATALFDCAEDQLYAPNINGFL
jgi:hypothetical protein